MQPWSDIPTFPSIMIFLGRLICAKRFVRIPITAGMLTPFDSDNSEQACARNTVLYTHE